MRDDRSHSESCSSSIPTPKIEREKDHKTLNLNNNQNNWFLLQIDGILKKKRVMQISRKRIFMGLFVQPHWIINSSKRSGRYILSISFEDYHNWMMFIFQLTLYFIYLPLFFFFSKYLIWSWLLWIFDVLIKIYTFSTVNFFFEINILLWSKLWVKINNNLFSINRYWLINSLSVLCGNGLTL